MGFFFRKTRSVGPFNFNFSTSGIGISTGVTGARVGVGPQGTTLSLGRGGFYYRKRLSRHTGLRVTDNPSNSQTYLPPSEVPAHLRNSDPDFDGINEALASDALLILRFLIPLPLLLLPNPYWALLPISLVLVGGPRYFTMARWGDKPGHWKFLSIVGLVIAWVGFFNLIPRVMALAPGLSGTSIDPDGLNFLSACAGVALVAASNRYFTGVSFLLGAASGALALSIPEATAASMAFGTIGLLGLIEKNSRWMFLGFTAHGEISSESDWTGMLADFINNNTAAIWITTNGQLHEASVGPFGPPHISTPCKMTGVHSRFVDLYFAPNGVILYDHRRTRFLAYDYADVRMESRTRYSSTFGNPPRDSQVVDRRWRHQRVNGGPDRRYKDNPCKTTFRMGSIALTVGGATFELVFSNPLVSENLFRLLGCAMEGLRTGVVPTLDPSNKGAAPSPAPPPPSPRPRPSSHGAGQSKPNPTAPPNPPAPPPRESPAQKRERAIALMGLRENWSEQELVVAYRKLAKDYHPDVHATLPPEFRELAHKKMSEITEAYDFLISGLRRAGGSS